MPTMFRIDGLRVVIWPNDHRPAHVHVIGAEAEAVFIVHCLGDSPELRESFGFRLAVINQVAEALVAEDLPTVTGALCDERRKFMAIIEQELLLAEQRMATSREEGYAMAARYDHRRGRVIVALNTGVELAFRVRLVEGLADAPPESLSKIEITPTGLGLHWPRLDTDLSIAGLLHGVFGSKAWMARELGAQGGRVRTTAKAAAVRANGARGGRPRKRSRTADEGHRGADLPDPLALIPNSLKSPGEACHRP
jgi:hypothetical protein